LCLQIRDDVAEIACAEVWTDRRQPIMGRGIAQDQPGSRPDGAGDSALGEQPRGQLAARHPKRAQQRELRTPAQQRQHLRGKDEKGAREQRNECQHVEIEAVSARDAGAAAGFGSGRRRVRAGGQALLQLAAKRRNIGSGLRAQVQAVELPDALETPLCRCDVHNADALAVRARRQQPGDPQGDDAGADL
jgi:hypothetical protein